MDQVGASDTPYGWMIYANNGRLFHNKKNTGETGCIAREGDAIGILYEVRAAQKPWNYDAGMGDIVGEEVIFKYE